MAGDASTYLTLKEIEYEMREVTAADWFPLGLQLGIKTTKLKEIEKDYPGDVRRCKIEVLDWWHRNTQEVSWLKLANAVEKTGEYDALAQRLRGKMPMRDLSPIIHPPGTAPTSEPAIETTSLHQRTPPHTGEYERQESSLLEQTREQQVTTGNTDSSMTPAPCATSRQNVYSEVKSYPPLAEQFQGLKAVDEEDLMTETIEIQSEFNVLFTRVRRSLMEKGVTVRDFMLFLRNVPGYPMKSLPESESLDLTEVFKVVRENCSWFNHLFLLEIINAYCGNDEELRKSYEKFCAHLRMYCKARIKKFPLKIWFGVVRKGCALMVLKVDRKWESIQIEQLEEVILNLAHILKVRRRTLHLYSIENGCVQLTLTIPSYISEELFPLTTEEEMNLMEMGVTDLQCGSYHFSQQRGLPRALPGLEEVMVESVKEGTQYQTGEFQDPPQVLQGQGFHIVIYNILSYLDDARSLCRAEQVCCDWYQVICKGLLWKRLIERTVKTDSVWRWLSERRGWRKYLDRRGDPSEEVTHQFYKQLYTKIIRDIDKLQMNWKSGDYTLTRIECHSKKDEPGVLCLQYDDNKIVSGHSDSTIKIWDRKSLSVTTELQGHTDSVKCLQYDDRVIVTGSYDSTIRVWDVSNGSLVNRLDHHRPVLSLRFNSDTLVTGSTDHTVAVWDMISPMDIFLRKELRGHTGGVWAVDFDDKYIVSGSNDKTIKVWQTSTGELVHTLHGHRSWIRCLQYRGKHIVSGSIDSTIRIWDIDRGVCLRVLEGHSGIVWSIRFDDRRIVSGGSLGEIKVWDFQAALDPRSQADTLCIQTLRVHSTGIYGLQFDDFQIVSGSQDDRILIWDFLDSAQPGYMQTDQSKDKKALT